MMFGALVGVSSDAQAWELQDHRWDAGRPSGLHLQRFVATVGMGGTYSVRFAAPPPQSLRLWLEGAQPSGKVSSSGSPFLHRCNWPSCKPEQAAGLIIFRAGHIEVEGGISWYIKISLGVTVRLRMQAVVLRIHYGMPQAFRVTNSGGRVNSESGRPVTASSAQTAFAFDASADVLELAITAVQAVEQPLLVTAIDSVYVGAVLSISRNTFLQLGGEAAFAEDTAAFLQLPSSSLVRIMGVADVAAADNGPRHGRYEGFTVLHHVRLTMPSATYYGKLL